MGIAMSITAFPVLARILAEKGLLQTKVDSIALASAASKKYGIRLSLRGFNLTNHFNSRYIRSNTADPRFGQFLSPYHRFFSGGFDVLF
jgi:hypothetical protein